jgi:methyl-accepting chemotaxis protein
MPSSRWQRLAPFLDVIGAVLIFGSWIASNALSQQAQNQANTHKALIDRVRQFRLYEDFAQRIVDIQSDLTRTRHLVEIAADDVSSVADKTESFPGAPTWKGMTATQVRELNDFVNALEQYSGQLTVSASTSRSIGTAREGAQDLSKEFRSAREAYDRLVTELDASSAPSDDVVAVEEELRKRVEQLWKKYDKAKQSMLHVGDDLLHSAAAESEAANRLATQFKYLSYMLYILGTLIILFGRAMRSLSAKEKRVD